MDTQSRAQLQQLQKELNASIDGLLAIPAEDTSKQTAGKVAQLRERISQQSDKLHAEIVTPTVRGIEFTWRIALNVAVRVGFDLDLYNLVPDGGIGLDALSKQTGADKTVLTRIMRMLAASYVFEETARDTFAATKMSKGLTQPAIQAMITVVFDEYGTHVNNAAYLKKTGYKHEPTPTACSAVDVHGVTFFQFLSQSAELMAKFQKSMEVQEDLPPESVPEYPYADHFDSITPETVHLVDVGGGRGFYLRDLLEKEPKFPGRIVLQDLSYMIEDAKLSSLPSRIELMPYDATTTQPITGAKYYFYRRVFHVWTDDVALAALRALHPAMKKGVSKLLIQDEVLPDVGCSAREAAQDVSMMAMGAKERSEAEWRSLLEREGFRVTRLIGAAVNVLKIIEAEVV